MAKAFYRPVFVSAVPTANGIELRAINDTGAALDLTVTATAVTMAGTTRELARATLNVTADAAALALTLPPGSLQADEILAYTWADASGQHRSGDHFAPRPYKTYDLMPAHLTCDVQHTGETFTLTVSASALSLFTAVEADQPGRFSVNAFTLFPGHPATVTFTPQTAGSAPQFTLRDLHSATY
jgi:beta-mannosidase